MKNEKSIHKSEWFYEGNISLAIVKYLINTKFSILKDNSKNIKNRGVDIIAENNKKKMLIEVKGYPSTFHTKGEYIGKIKKTKPEHQAKHWFNEVIMTSISNYSKYRAEKNIQIAIGLPQKKTYSDLLSLIKPFINDHNIKINIYLVDESFNVECFTL
jgi:hypothetical protein